MRSRAGSRPASSRAPRCRSTRPWRSCAPWTRSVAKPLLDDLAHGVAGPLVEEAHLPRPLVRRELSGDVVDQRLRVRRVALGHDPGDDALAEVRVLLAGHRRLLDARVVEQRDLDLAGADLVAAGLDQVGRAAADDAPVAVLADGREVAGEEPAVAHRLVGGVLAVEVAGEEVGAADGDLADRLVVRGVELVAVVVDEA